MMCGVIACAGVWTRGDLEWLLALAAERGPHGWGVLAAQEGRCATMRGLGRYRIGGYAGPLPTTGSLIGHARLATSADRSSVAALQPLTAGAVSIAHNGTVPDAAAWGIPWPSRNDSEVLAGWLDRATGAWEARLLELAGRLSTPYAVAVLAGGAVYLMRRHHPLYVAPGRACSRPFAGAMLLPEDLPVRLKET